MPHDATQILQGLQVDDNIKADAWDAIYDQSLSDEDFTARLQGMPLPDEVKAELYDARYAEAAQGEQPAAASAEAPVEEEGGLPTGALSVAGGAAKAANRTVRPAIAATGRYVAKAAKLPAIIGGTLGAGLGGGAGAAMGGGVIGAMGGATLGAEAGRRAGKAMTEPIIKAGRALDRNFALKVPQVTLEEALEAQTKAGKAATHAKKVGKVASPRSAAATKATQAATTAKAAVPRVGQMMKPTLTRKIVNYVGGRALPVVGNALMIADIMKGLYGLQKGEVEERQRMIDDPNTSPEQKEMLEELMLRTSTGGY